MDQFYIIYRRTLNHYGGDYDTNDVESSFKLFEKKEDAYKEFQELSWAKGSFKKHNVFLYEIAGEDLAPTKQILSVHINWGDVELNKARADKFIDDMIASCTKALRCRKL